jgi:hypothetical protein
MSAEPAEQDLEEFLRVVRCHGGPRPPLQLLTQSRFNHQLCRLARQTDRKNRKRRAVPAQLRGDIAH